MEKSFLQVCFRELAVGASHDRGKGNVAPEPRERKRKQVESLRVSCVSAQGELHLLSGICRETDAI